MGFPWEIWNSENNNQQHDYKVYRLSTSAVNRFCICLSTLYISYTLQVPQKRYIGTFKILVFFKILGSFTYNPDFEITTFNISLDI